MPRSRPPYPPEFRAQIISLARTGRSVPGLAHEFEPSEQTIHAWLKQADRDDGKRADGLSTTEHEELRRLRKENRQLRQEREVLAIAISADNLQRLGLLHDPIRNRRNVTLTPLGVVFASASRRPSIPKPNENHMGSACELESRCGVSAGTLTPPSSP